MKNSFFNRFTPKEPKFFPLLKQLSEVLSASSVALVESLQHDQPTERSEYYKKIKDLEREGDRLTHLIFDELGTTFITPFDREDIYEFFITKLFEEEKDCIELIKIKEIMHELEKTTDAAEHVGKILKSLIVKYA